MSIFAKISKLFGKPDKNPDVAASNPRLLHKISDPLSEKERRSEEILDKKSRAPGPWQVGDWIRPDGGRAYEVREIKGGGMGQVYICIREDDRMPFALKTFQEKYLNSKAAIDRFRWESEVWVRLGKHKNIVRAHRTDTLLGYTFVLLEYVVGDEYHDPDLSGWIRKGGLSIPLALNFACQFCSGMIHAKEAFDKDPALKPPFVHRDIKPQNIMVTRDRIVKVTDFGLVKSFGELEGDIDAEVEDELRERRHTFTKKGAVCGTFPYIAPEIWRGEELDGRSDIYSFGCVLYEMFYGVPPFVYSPYDPERYRKYKYAHLNLSPKPIRSISDEINEIILKCLEKERDKRYQNFEALREALINLYYQQTGERLVLKEESEAEWEASDWLEKGTGFMHLDFHEEAIESYNKAIELRPDYDLAYNNIGIAYYNKGILDEAISCYKKALEINPRYAFAHNNLGNAYKNKGMLDEAISCYKKALEINPRYAFTYNNLGIAYNNRGLFDEAIKCHKKALELDNRFILAHNNLGTAYRYQGNSDEAIRCYKKALHLNPRDAVSHTNLGAVYSDKGMLDEAIRCYKKALHLNPRDAFAYNNLGLAYYRKGMLDEAISCYKKALEINPRYAQIRYGIAQALEDKGDLSGALSQWQTYLEVAEGMPSQKDWIPKAHEHMRDLKKKLREKDLKERP